MAITIQRFEPRHRSATRSVISAALLPLDGLDECWATWVAIEGDEVVGTASLERHESAHLLRSVAVEPTHRRHGIGEQLVRTALAAVTAPVVLLTETAEAWFECLGFERTTRDALDPALLGSPELQYLCPDSATVMLLRPSADVG